MSNPEEMLLLDETCFAVEQGRESGEKFGFAEGDLYRRYRDPDLHPVFQSTIRQILLNTSYFTE